MSRFDNSYTRFIESYPYPRFIKSYQTAPYPGAFVFHHGKKLLDFASNDYLGLARHPALIKGAQDFAERFGTGSSSSRLVRGNLSIFDDLEETLAQQLGQETALLFPSGYQANATILEALLDKNVLGEEPLVFCDKAIHISLYAGLTHLNRFQRFPHNKLEQLELLLKKANPSIKHKFIIAESVYSMEGDQADIQGLIDLAKHYHALLYLDDAHAVGLYGPSGFGLGAKRSGVDLVMGTFSKALGSLGGYLGCSKTLRSYLSHRCKGLIYSTALPPPLLGSIKASLDLLPHLEKERQKVFHFSELIRHFFKKENLNYGHSNTYLIPWILGSAEKTRLASQLLEEQGILASAIQAPTVPAAKSRIRFCVSALHNENDLNLLFTSIQTVKRKLKI